MLPDLDAAASRAARSRAAGRSRSAYTATIAFISILCVVVVGHDLFRTWQDRSRQLESARREVANLSWAVGEHAEAAFLLADTTLIGLAERVKADGTGPDQIERLHLVMMRRVEASPVLQSLSVVDETGTILADSRPEIPRINVSDRAYFQFQRTNNGHQPHVGMVLQSRVSGKSIIPMSVRLTRPDGSFAGLVVASVEVAYFQDFYAKLDLGHDGIAGLFNDDGVMLVRHPFLQSAVGSSVMNGALFHDALPNAPSGTFDSLSSLDGVRRIDGYRRVTGFPLVAAAALGVDEQLAVWRKGALEHLLATIVIAVLLGFIGVRLVMQVRRLTRAEQATAVATEAARTAAAQYRLIADNASDMVVTVDMQFVRRYVSPGCRDLLGYEPEELTGGIPLSLTHPDDVERVGQCLRDMVAGQDRALINNRVRHRDGHWVWIEVSLRLIRDPDSGAALEICAALRDITHRLAAETALRESERELERSNADLRELTALNVASQYARSLLEASLDPMVTISLEGKITDVNEATINITGQPRQSLIGTDFSDYFTEPARAREAYQRAFAKGSVRDYPLTIRHQNETPTEVLYNASVYNDADGNILGVFAAARDMTAQVRAEAEIAERRGKEHERLEELERFQRLTVGRELKMIDLKKEIEELKKAGISTVAE
jgi:PAS domain S-box-containing protein